jgi:alpha-L-fucosidase 2
VPFNPPLKSDPYLDNPQFGHDGDSMWMTMVLPDGFAFAVVVQVPDTALDFESVHDRVTGHINNPTAAHLSLHLTIMSEQDESPAELVRRGKTDLLRYADAAQPHQTHQRWWANFWHKGWISLPEKLVENLWYAEIYKIACCSRQGGQAPGQMGHWNGFPDPPWRGDYHTNINIQEIYWPIYSANHPELGWPFYDLYLGILDYIIEDTARYTKMPGARFVRGHGRSGRPFGRGPNWELWPGAGAWLCSHFWWHYQFTQDIEFLRNSYCMFRACLDFFIAYLGEPDKNGRYHIIPSLAHEQSRQPPVPGAGFSWGKNSSYDLGILRDHLMHTIRASEILAVDQAERENWQEVLHNLAPYPVSADGWLEEWEGISLWQSHRHLSPLYPIFPGEEINQDSQPEIARIGRQSVLRFLARGSDGYAGFSFGWIAACAARMGMAEEALASLHSHIRAYVNINGYSLLGPSRFPGLAPYVAARKGPQWNTKLPNCEAGGNFCAGINELLLCSPSGNINGRPLIRVFPAIVEAWQDVRISRLRAQGAFLITAERRDGHTAYVLIESEAGADCQLANPWPDQAVTVTQSQEIVPHRVDGNVILFVTQVGQAYAVCPAGAALDDLEMIELAGSEESRYQLGIGGPFEAISWRDFDPGL